MTQCTACGTENADGMRFCVKCGAAIAAAPDPGSWKAPSGNLYETPTPSGGLGSQGGFAPGGYSAPNQMAYPAPGGMQGIGGMPYALWADRVIAALIDAGLVLAVIIVLYFVIAIIGIGGTAALGSVSEGAGGLFGSFACCSFFILPVLGQLIVGLYNKVYLVSKRGFSIGQGVMKLKVVNEQGNLIEIGTAVIRLLAQIGLTLVPVVGGLLDLLWPLWDEPKRQTLHDKAVGTVVVKTGQ